MLWHSDVMETGQNPLSAGRGTAWHPLSNDHRQAFMETELRIHDMLRMGQLTVCYYDERADRTRYTIGMKYWDPPKSLGDLQSGHYFSASTGRVPFYFDEAEIEGIEGKKHKSRALVSPETLLRWLKKNVQRDRTEVEWKLSAEAHFGGAIARDNVWRIAWKEVPKHQKRAQGQTATSERKAKTET